MSILNSKTLPIKIVEKPLQSSKHVVNGTGISAVIAETVFLTNKIEKQQPQQKAWQVLLDSGLDGDLIFITKKNLKNIPHKKGTLQKNGRPQMEPLKQQR